MADQLFEIVHVTLRCHSKGTPAPLSSSPPLFRHYPIALWERHLPCPWLSTSKTKKEEVIKEDFPSGETSLCAAFRILR